MYKYQTLIFLMTLFPVVFSCQKKPGHTSNNEKAPEVSTPSVEQSERPSRFFYEATSGFFSAELLFNDDKSLFAKSNRFKLSEQKPNIQNEIQGQVFNLSYKFNSKEHSALKINHSMLTQQCDSIDNTYSLFLVSKFDDSKKQIYFDRIIQLQKNTEYLIEVIFNAKNCKELSFEVNSTFNNFASSVQADLLRMKIYEEIQSRGIESGPGSIDDLNSKTFESLEKIKNTKQVLGTRGELRATFITSPIANKVISSINAHSVVSSYAAEKYRRSEAEIGFCFGRATYTHLILLKMGLAKGSIKKAWAVGPMKNGVDWAFHVTTIALSDKGEWITLDNFNGRSTTVAEWFRLMQSFNQEQKNLRFYFSEPEKFSVSVGKYSNVQLGLNLSQSQDWYSHYFLDLLKSIKNEPLSLYNLPSLKTTSASH